MSNETNARDDDLTRPRFRGCVFCYAGEMTYFGAKKAVRRVRSSE